jgi:ATP-binding cassette subfamily B protein
MDVPAEESSAFESQRENADNAMRRLFTEYGDQQSAPFALGLAASILARVLDLLPPLLLGVAIDAVFLDNSPYRLPLVPASSIPATREGQFWFTVGAIAVSFVGGAALHWVRNWGWNTFAQEIQHAVRTDTYDAMQRLDLAFFEDRQTGEMMSVLSNDVNRLESFLNDGLNSLFRLAVMVVGIGAILFWLNPQLAAVALLPIPFIAVFTKRFIETIQPKYAEVRSVVGRLNSRLENNLGGIGVIKSANTESYESARVDDVSGDYFDANWDAIETRITFFPALRLIAGAGFALTFVIGGLWVFRGEAPLFFSGDLGPGAFVTFILYTQRFIWPMAQFGQIINMYQRARASAERVFGLMDEPPRVADAPDATDLVVDDGAVVYDDVTFAYGDDEGDPVLSEVSFDAAGGDTIAIVGPTGAGKSTVVKLLLRLYDVDGGAIEIDGQDLRDVTRDSLRRAIGYVGQEPFMFSGSVRDNVAYGAFDASDEEIVAATKAAEAHEFVTALPDGYDTTVGERGVKLSGGQRQRLAIARAVLRDPDILVFDEATSDVDTETEYLIQRSLDDLTADRTTFVIAHRLSTVKDADRIVVVEGGRVTEMGSHEDLLDADGLYAHLWRVQAGDIDDLPREFLERARGRDAASVGDD